MLSCRAVSRSDRYKDPGPPGGPNDFYTNMPTKKKHTHILLSLGERFVYQEVRLWCEQNINCNLRN